MSSNTTNLGLYKKDPVADGNDTFNIKTMLNDNWDKIEGKAVSVDASLSDLIYQTAGGTATVITLTIKGTLVNGYPIPFIASASNSGAATTINTKKLYKPGTTTAPTLTAGKAYTVWYNLSGDCFFIKASAEGDADVSNVLATKKFSNDNDTGLVGTMPNNGTLSGALNCGASYTIPLGYTTGGTITANSLASQTVASATANQILYGITAWINGSKVTGTIPSKTSSTYNPSTVAQTISTGQYLSGDQIIAATIGTANVAQVLAGYTFNSANGIGLTGTATISSIGGKSVASGTSPAGLSTSVTLPFTPSVVLARHTTENSLFVLINTPSMIGLGSAVAYDRLTTLNSSNYGTVTPVSPTAVTGAPGVYITGNVLNFTNSSSQSYQYYAFS